MFQIFYLPLRRLPILCVNALAISWCVAIAIAREVTERSLGEYQHIKVNECLWC